MSISKIFESKYVSDMNWQRTVPEVDTNMSDPFCTQSNACKSEENVFR